MDNSMTTLMMHAGPGHRSGRSRHRVISAICLTALGLGALVATGPVEAAPALPATTKPSASVQLTFICRADLAGVTDSTSPGTLTAPGQYVFRVTHQSGAAPVAYKVAIGGGAAATTGSIGAAGIQFVVLPKGSGYSVQPDSNLWTNSNKGTASANETQICSYPVPNPVTTEPQLRNAITTKGGIINVAPGRYDLATELEFRRDGTEIRATTPGATILRYTGQADRSTSRVAEVWAKNVVIDGFEIRGGRNPNDDGGGGVEVESGASLTLRRSTVTDNRDDRGAGILNEGTINIVDSTITGNIASYKGGGFLNDIPSAGSATITNSTIEGNSAPRGPGITSFDNLTVVHSTIVRNTNTSSPSSSNVGGVQRYGGNFTVQYSIIGGNLRNSATGPVPALDCGGTLIFDRLNFVSNLTGCPTAVTTVVPLTGGPLVGPLQNNGGPTLTAAPLEGSKVIGAYVNGSSCAVGLDQRGTQRPSGGRCDLGSFEIAALSATAGLTVDTTKYTDQGLPAGTVEVGVTSIPTSAISGQVAADTPINADGTVDTKESAGVRRIGVRRIAEEPVTVEELAAAPDGTPKAAGVRRIALESIGVRRIAVRSADLRDVGVRRIGVRRIGGLETIPLSDIPLLRPGGWTALLAGSEFQDLPLQSITLEDIAARVPEDLTLASIDLSGTALGQISLPSVLLEGATLTDIPLTEDGTAGNAKAWCDVLFGAAACEPDLVAEVAEAQLWEAQLAGANVDQEAVLGVPLSGIASAGVRRIGVRRIGVRRIALEEIYLENSSLASIGVRRIGVRRIDTDGFNGPDTGIDAILNCTPGVGPCSTDPSNTLTLGDIARECTTNPVACKFKDGAEVGTLLDLLSGEGTDTNFIAGLSLIDLFLAFVPPEDVPWQAVDLEGTEFQNIAGNPQPTFDYVTQVALNNGPADVTVVLTIPAGFVVASPATSPATWCPTSTPTCTTTAQPTADAANPTYVIPNVGSGTYRLRVPVRAGTTVGTGFDAKAEIAAAGPNGTSSIVTSPVAVDVVQDNVGTSTSPAPVLADGQLQLGYIGGNGELDAYSFIAPANTTGASARVLLSNIPEGVDYDLTVYGPRPGSLRNPPTRELTSLGDIRFDLDPDSDSLPTDVVNDIAVDINAVATGVGVDLGGASYALRDISSRRSNNDEEVALPALVGGEKYVVVVSGYFGDLSPEPYGLRVRLDRRTALPECAPPPFDYAGAPSWSGSIAPELEITPDIDTLYVTNASRLEAESTLDPASGGAQGVIDAIAGTDGINDVDAGLLLVDDLPLVNGIDVWENWNADSCSPDARNAVATAIGDAIDGVNGGANIENIVIVGGDGVIPMAAVPDLTEYSNESTFAREVLTGGLANSVSGTVGAGYLLSDDPYATDAGISVLNGDHELYVPDRAIGRLVETTGEIIGQLENFTAYDGQLDPETFTPQAAVTGYDFLDDGAEEIIGELAGPYVVDPLTGPLWDKGSFLDLFRADPITGARKDYTVFSPNAHYDFESLLPAAADFADDYTNDDLVTTADFDPGTGVFAPVAALGFTVGCHAGLSVSDVQLGLPTLDWAQLAAGNGSQWIGHTTYGYGDTDIVAYSERLAALFASNVADITTGEVGAPTSLGAAVRDAKQRYLAGTLVLTPYDEKILQSWTYYGLPMFTIGNDVPVNARSAGPESTTSTEPPAPEITTPEITTTAPLISGIMRAGALTAAAATVGPVTFSDANPTTGRVPVSIDLTGGLLVENIVEADGSSYYSVDGNTTSAQFRPVQPLVDVAIPDATPGRFGGFLITGLATRDLGPDHVPFYNRPIVDNGTDEGPIVVEDGAFPATLQRIADLGDGQRLLVAAGQYQDGQRLFERISGELIPRTDALDTDAPGFLDVTGTNIDDVGSNGRGIRFDVETDATATRVVIVFREIDTLGWRTIELSKRAATDGVATWFGAAPLVSGDPDAVAEFFAQSVDAAGNVGLTSNKIENFQAVEPSVTPPPVDAPTAPRIVAGQPNVGGRFFDTGATFTIEDAPAKVSVDGLDPFDVIQGGVITLAFEEGATATYNQVTRTLTLDRGSHTIVADNGGTTVSRFFIVDPDGPTVTLSRDTAAWTNQPVSLFATANDGSGSGMATLCLDGVPCVTAGADGVFEAGPRIIGPALGEFVETPVTATGTDRLGNLTTKTTTVRVDNAPPVITIEPDDAIVRNGEVTITVSATEVGAGLATLCANGSTCAAAGASTVQITSPAGFTGPFAVSAVATDFAGNEVTKTIGVQIDNDAPGVTFTPDTGAWTTGDVDVEVEATDIGSGLAAFTVDGTPASNPVTVPVRTGAAGFIVQEITASATDKADNTTTRSTTVRIDNAKPGLTISPNTTDWSKGPVDVVVTASDDGSGLDAVCRTEGGTCTPVELDDGQYRVTISAEGTTELSFTATDVVGNETISTSTVRIDSIAPEVTITPDDDTWRKGPVQVTVTATDGGSGLVPATAQVCTGDACEQVVLGANGTYVTTVNVTDVGVAPISAEAVDVAGNSTTVSASLRIDNQAPTLTITPPATTAWSRVPVTLSITAADGAGAGVRSITTRTCTIGVPCTSPSVLTTGSTATATVDAPAGQAVTSTVDITAADTVGNVSPTETRTIRIDKADPTASLTVTPDANGDGIYNFNEVATATFSCADVGSGIKNCALFDGNTQIATTSPYTINTSGPATRTLTVRAIDNVDNSFTSSVATLNVGFRTCPVSTTQSTLLPTTRVRVQLCDAAGTNLSSPSIVLTALAVTGAFGTRDPIVNFSGLTLTYRFTYNTAGRFYEYTFFTGGLPRGVDHRLSFTTKQPSPNRNIGLPALDRLATNTVTFRLR